MNTQHVLVLLCAYLIGSIPTAYIITYIAKGKDIRNLGNGNAGAKNTFESVGKIAGLAVFLFDVGKGVAAITIARSNTQVEYIVFLAGACAIIGHDFPLFLRFKGGQGMATTVGILGALFPKETVCGFFLFLFLLALTHRWDFSCFIAFISLVVLLGLMGQSLRRVIYTILILPLIGLNKIILMWQKSFTYT
jgi:glycerol-3-phosphate acyltransferase PlsY